MDDKVYPPETVPLPPLLSQILDHYGKHLPSELQSYHIEKYLYSLNPKVTYPQVSSIIDYYSLIEIPRVIRINWLKLWHPEFEIWHSQKTKFHQLLILRRYSPRTIKSYLGSLRLVQKYFWINEGLMLSDVPHSRFLNYFITLTNLGYSVSSIKLRSFSLKLFFNQILNKSLNLDFLSHLKRKQHLPQVLSRPEINLLISSLSNLKHRLIISLMYSSGLRVSEVVSLRVSDIDLSSLSIRVREGKGNKDRITIFSKRLCEEILRIISGKKPSDYLFNSQTSPSASHHISVRTVQKILESAVEKSHLGKHITPHDLRHSFATHLLENGTDIRLIQKLLGHKNIGTTMIYTRVTGPQIKSVKSPL